MQADVDLGVGLTQARHRFGQHIAGLGVGGGDRQGPAVFSAVLFSNSLKVSDLTQDQLDALEHMLPRLGDAFESFTMAGKNFNAQFLFQLDDGF